MIQITPADVEKVRAALDIMQAHEPFLEPEDIHVCREALAILDQAKEAQGETVAWRHLAPEAYMYEDQPEQVKRLTDEYHHWEPLYLHPPSAPAADVAELLEKIQAMLIDLGFHTDDLMSRISKLIRRLAGVE